MEEDRKQLQKAQEKMDILETLTSVFEEINKVEDDYNQKRYVATIDYRKEKERKSNGKKEFYKFRLTLKKETGDIVKIFNKDNTILDITFSLYDKNIGLDLIMKAQEKLVETSNMKYASFQRSYDKRCPYSSHIINTSNNINFVTKIHSNDEILRLQDHNKALYQIKDIIDQKEENNKKANKRELNKDEQQIKKAINKCNGLTQILNCYSRSNKLETDYNKKNDYKVFVDYFEDQNENSYYNIDKFYKFFIVIKKNDKEILKLSFSVENYLVGSRLIQKVAENFIQHKEDKHVLPCTIKDRFEAFSVADKITLSIKVNQDLEQERNFYDSLCNINEFSNEGIIITSGRTKKIGK